MTIKHAFVSPKSDVADDTLIRPTNWNANHVLAGEGAKVYHSADQSVPHNTWTALAFDSERYDTDTIHDVTTNNSRLTCKTAGKYSIKANVTFAGNATGSRWLRILIGPYLLAIVNSLAVSTEYTCLSLSGDVNMAVDDYVELCALQSSGGALDVKASGGNEITDFSIQRIG